MDIILTRKKNLDKTGSFINEVRLNILTKTTTNRFVQNKG